MTTAVTSERTVDRAEAISNVTSLASMLGLPLPGRLDVFITGSDAGAQPLLARAAGQLRAAGVTFEEIHDKARDGLLIHAGAGVTYRLVHVRESAIEALRQREGQ